MRETLNNFYIGFSIHFGATFLFLLSLRFIELNVTNLLLSFLASGTPIGLLLFSLEHFFPVVDLPRYRLRDLFVFLIDSLAEGLFAGTLTIWLTYWFHPIQKSTSWGTLLLAFILTDLCYYLLHRYRYHDKWYWIHADHHQISQLDLLRGNHASLIDQGVLSFALPSALIGWLMGLDLYQSLIIHSIILLMQLSHHANYTANIGKLRFLILDSHAHKLHHCIGGHKVNFGVVLSIWDQVLGTFYENYDWAPNYLHQQGKVIPRA